MVGVWAPVSPNPTVAIKAAAAIPVRPFTKTPALTIEPCYATTLPLERVPYGKHNVKTAT